MSKTSKKKWGGCIGVLLCLVLLTTSLLGCTTEPEPAPASTPAPAPIPIFATQKDMDDMTKRVSDLIKTSAELDSDIKDLARNSGASQSSLDAVANRVNSVESSISTLTSKVNSADSVSQSSFTAFQNDVNNRLTQLEADNATLKSAVAALNEQMEANTSGLEPDGSDVDPEDAVELELRYFPLYTVKAGDSTLVIPMRLKSENMLNAAISDVVLAIEVRTSGNLGVDNMTLTGGGATWIGYGSGSTWSFENWSEIKYKALESNTFTPTLSVTFDIVATENENVTLDIEVFCDDYELD